MTEDRVTIVLPAEMRRAATVLARERDITLGQLVRDVLAAEIGRRHRARPPVRADERLVAPLRARLAGDLAHAVDWQDLQRRLAAKGYALREAGGGLALHEWPGGRRLCKASELGFSYSRLMRRLGRPFPGHAHVGLAGRVLAPHAPDPGIGDDDVILIEPD